MSVKRSASKTNGDAIGIYKFDKEGIYYLCKELDKLVKKNNTKHLFTLAVKKILNKVKISSVSTQKNR